jgi:Ca-activated chloride channel family protein
VEGAAAMNMVDLRYFSWPWALALVIVLPLVATGLIIKARRMRARRLEHLGTPAMIARLAPTAASTSRWQPIRLGLAALFIAIAFSGPRWGLERTVVKQPGIDVILALDASSSMLGEDEKPNRLAKMKQVVDRLRDLSPNDRFALIAFAGKSYVLSPVTIDQAGLNLFIDNLDPTVVGQAGSSLSSALHQANNLLAISKSSSERAIVLMSDGEGFENVDDIIAEGKRAAEAGTTIITVGFGTEAGSTIPVTENGTTTEKKDQQGNIVVTKYSPTLLKAAADAGKGVFVPPTDPDRALTVRQTLAKLRTESRSMSKGTNLAQRFQYFLLPAILLLLLDAFLATRRGRRRELSAVGTTASMVMLATFFNGCSNSGITDKESAKLYNQATAMMSKPDSLKAALPILKKAALSKDTVVQYRSGFNAGYIHLKAGLALKGDSAKEPLDSALSVYKRVLTLRPDDPDSKWNYELALREDKNGGGGGGGGGGGAKNPTPQPTPGGNSNETPQPRPIPGMNEAKAEQILNSMEQQEQDVQGRKQRRSVPTPPPNGRDW